MNRIVLNVILSIYFLWQGVALAIADELTLSKTEINNTVMQIAQTIEQQYYDEDKATVIARNLLNTLDKGDFYASYRQDELITLINSVFASPDGDGFISLNEQALDDSFTLSSGQSADVGYQIEYQKLDNNIGYIHFSGNFQNISSIEQLTLILAKLDGSSAYIIDTLDASDASFTVIHHFISCFVKPDIHLANLKRTDSENLTPVLSLSSPQTPQTINSNSISTKSLVILQSAFAQQAWEFFNLALQQQGALIIGEESIGNASLNKTFIIDKYFELSVPFALFQAPDSDRSWKNSGITPDYFASEADALALAKEKIQLLKTGHYQLKN
ncbi:hypothetical protein LP316_08340 [Thalassotalea sp. LPB0316]|uniref:S41 family peptidase n=1 Tax=Thalassotalea sp. LPB0316 TaxID=2769490 RepID=UPI0018669F4A|nr:S41 family peptidase [Thalassotalea sp. LPB0316]QOL24384.1 hypothetical protein LP316_08340 [Thalassotalea sp. LPB0316]